MPSGYQALGQGIEDLGNDIYNQMLQYHKEHERYSQELSRADALSRIGIDKRTGAPVDIQLDEKGKPIKDENVMDFGNPRSLDAYREYNRRNAAANLGRIDALQRLWATGLLRAQSSAIEEAFNPKETVEVVPGRSMQLSPANAAHVLMSQEAAKAAPQGKQYWEGDETSPPGYYTPNQIARIQSGKQAQTARSGFQQLKTDIDIAQRKLNASGQELTEFTKAYGFPAPLFGSTTKVYSPGSKIHGTPGWLGKSPDVVPEGQYAIDFPDPKTGDTRTAYIGTAEFDRGKKIYDQLQGHRQTIANLSSQVQTAASKAAAMLDWATRNPNAPNANAVKAKAQADLNALGSITGGDTSTQPQSSPPPYTDENE